ncbi:MAG: Gfo/Idh/MocA family oxidoreductase [Solirubrobacterales bacterium]|nr:Gfo/Idh/MocA family oxidoreductase [Solirubrobacterales bacterium]
MWPARERKNGQSRGDRAWLLGANLARNFHALPGCELAWCCDDRPEARERFAPIFPRARFTGEPGELLADPTLDTVVVATPVPSHAELATRVLEAGKHCFVEKPLALTAADAAGVLAVQRDSGRTLLVGHLVEYHPGVRQLKQMVDSGQLGDVHYIYSNRLNLGKLRADALEPRRARRLSGLHLAGEEPDELVAHGGATSGRASKTSCSASCAFRRASPRICTCPGSTRTKSGGSP